MSFTVRGSWSGHRMAPAVLRLLTFVVFSSLVHSSASVRNEGTVNGLSVKGLFRHRRQSCQDGTYEHDGRTCCMCAAGQRLVSHCSTMRQDDQKCEHCADGTYSSHPNFQEFCVRCTSCDHPNANLEEAESCTRGRNSKCRCKAGHYCDTETCVLCHPCQECGAEGVKAACTATSNTVCNDAADGGNSGLIVKIIVPIVVIAAAAAAAGFLAFSWKRKKFCFKQPDSVHSNGAATSVEMLPLNDIEPHLPELARVLGWKDMRDIALSSGMKSTDIESCALNHPGDSEEQTLELLQKWVEEQGRASSQKLIQMLRKHSKRAKSEKVVDMLRNCDSAAV